MKPTLPTNYKDDILNTSVEGMRRYQMIYNSDNTVSFKDVTPYDQTGSDFGAGDINLTNEAVNQSADVGKIIDDPDTAEATTEEGYIAGVQLFNHVNSSLQWKLLGSATGKTAINLPSVFNELYVELSNTNSTAVNFAYAIPYNTLTDKTKGYRQGGYASAQSFLLAVLNVSKTSCIINSVQDTNGDNSSKYKITVYYR